MNAIAINDKISYIEATEKPLSADIGIIRDGGDTWLFDVGDGADCLPELEDKALVVLSHFHRDHIGNIDRIPAREIYVSKETYAHIHRGKIVEESIYAGNLHIFPLPSSHTKGCLGLEIDSTYAFVGDALYSRAKDGCYVYNAQLLQEEIKVLKALQAPFLLVSHFPGLVRERETVITELEMIYSMRSKEASEIRINREG